MYLFDQKQQKHKVKILITSNYCFIMKPFNCQLIRKYKLVELNSILSITCNSSLMALKFREPRDGTVMYNIKETKGSEQNDCMLETYRRTEFIVFLLNNADSNKRGRPQLSSTNQFKIDKSVIDFDIADAKEDDKLQKPIKK